MREAPMSLQAPASAAARLGGLVRLLHPFPSALNAAVAGALACVAVRGWPGSSRLVALMATMLCIQCAIGALNDWADRALDAAAKPGKPIPAGLVPVRMALGAAVVLALTAAMLAATFGPAAWALAMAGLGVGVAYDLGVKRTPWSALTYALALPLIPVWVWTALDLGSPALAVVAPVGFLLGFGLQLVNALPDAAGDERGGVRGTLQVLGPERGRRVAWASIALALTLALMVAPLVGLRPLPFALCWPVAALLLLAAIVAYQRDPSVRSLRLGWSLLAPAAGVLAVGWLGSLPG